MPRTPIPDPSPLQGEERERTASRLDEFCERPFQGEGRKQDHEPHQAADASLSALLLAVAVLAAMLLAWTVPIVAGGLDRRSGFVAYATHWKTMSALFPALERLADAVLRPLALAPETPGRLVRAVIAVVLGVVALVLARRPLADADDLLARAGTLTATLVLLSPAQFPWYGVWMLPFLAIRPRFSLIAVTVGLALYYVSFHHHATDTYHVFRDRTVWLVWVPLWALLAWELWRQRTGARGSHA